MTEEEVAFRLLKHSLWSSGAIDSCMVCGRWHVRDAPCLRGLFLHSPELCQTL